MAWTTKKAKSKCYCMFCGSEIKWVRGKKQPGQDKAKSIPVEPRIIYFLPDSGGRAFVTKDGNERPGREAGDGLMGFSKHDCPIGPTRKVLSEKELKARQWA